MRVTKSILLENGWHIVRCGRFGMGKKRYAHGAVKGSHDFISAARIFKKQKAGE